MKKKVFLVSGIACIALVIAIVSFAVWGNRSDAMSRVDENISTFSIEYEVTPQNIAGKIMSVSIKLTPAQLSPQKTLYLDAGNITASEPVCLSDTGAEVTLSSLGTVWEIGPLEDGVQYVEFQYDVRLGENSGEDFKVTGDMYEDLAVFQGKNMLMLPWLDEANLNVVERYISSLKFEMKTDQNWKSIMPYTPVNSDTKSFEIQNPTWYDLYDLSNSSYCFGSFEPLNFTAQNGEEAVLYLDTQIAKTAELNDLNMVMTFYNYYTGVFSQGLKETPVVLLRNSMLDESAILGGVGGQGMAISLDMATPDDAQTMSRSIYHAFFDSKVTARNLRYQPNMWLYEGLTNYYVDLSAQLLPLELKEIYEIDPQDDMSRKYMRYLFFSLKDPLMMAVSADMEGTMTNAQDDFYFGVKVPLILHTIEYYAGKENPNALIDYLVAHEPRTDLDVSRLMKDLLQKNEAVVRQYFSGASFIPNYWGLSANEYDREDILEILGEAEDFFADLYNRENISYPYDPVMMINETILRQEIKTRKLSFASPEVQDLVKNYSETLYLLLMQNALRADLCGIKDPSAPGVKAALNTRENAEKWLAYVKQVGEE